MVDFDEGLLKVVFKATAKVSPKAVQKALDQFDLNGLELEIAGEIADKDGLVLSAKNGQTYRLANRAAKDSDDKPEDLVAKLQGWLKEGKTSVRLDGALTEKDDVLTLSLAKAEHVEKK